MGEEGEHPWHNPVTVIPGQLVEGSLSGHHWGEGGREGGREGGGRGREREGGKTSVAQSSHSHPWSVSSYSGGPLSGHHWGEGGRGRGREREGEREGGKTSVAQATSL